MNFEDFYYDDHSRRDPMWSLVSSGGSILTYESDLDISDLNLEGIIYESNNSIAIINGKVLKTGDKIGQYVITDMTETSVVLMNGRQRFVLKLKKEE